MKALFDRVSQRCSRLTTEAYSTSFSVGIRCLKKTLQEPIYAIYGFVRFADEIVDSFDGFDKAALLQRFEEDTFRAVRERISLNPILNSFQATVLQYGIEDDLIAQFLQSMAMDLRTTTYDDDTYEAYILGSAEVVGLMCLRVFCQGDHKMFDALKPYAMRLGAAFQKVNFLRDLRADYVGLGRVYFPGLKLDHFDDASKKRIEASIRADFEAGYTGIKKLPRSARFGVYVAYVYYLALFRKITNTPSDMVMRSRIRIPKRHKATLLAYSFVKHQLNWL